MGSLESPKEELPPGEAQSRCFPPHIPPSKCNLYELVKVYRAFASQGNLTALSWEMRKRSGERAPALRACAEGWEPCMVGSLQVSVRFPRPHFERRTRKARPAGQDGVAAGLEARTAAGQRPQRPPRLATNALQVGGGAMRPASGLDLSWLGFWKGARAWVTLEKPQLWSRSAGPISAFHSPGYSLFRGLPETGPKPTPGMLGRGGKGISAGPCPASWRVMSIANHALCDLGNGLFYPLWPSVSPSVR